MYDVSSHYIKQVFDKTALSHFTTKTCYRYRISYNRGIGGENES